MPINSAASQTHCPKASTSASITSSTAGSKFSMQRLAYRSLMPVSCF